MSEKKDDKYAKVRAICESLGFSKGKTSDEYLFTLYAIDLFFYKRNIGAIDIKNGFTDGPNDGGIDFIYTDGDTLYLIQGKSTNSLSFNDIREVFNKMSETVSNFDNRKIDKYSNQFINAYQNAYDYLSDDKNIEFVLFTNTKLEDRTRNEISDFATDKDYALSVYDANDIEIKELFQGSELIGKDSIQLYKEDNSGSNNILRYQESGIIVNVKASELQRLYRTHANEGLFSYNLRELIAQKSVDDGINDTIKNDKDKFWFFNNGVTIGCEDFKKDGDRIRLYGFSIINGAQTTTKIGESKLINNTDHDFAVVCKVVKADGSMKNDSDFISRISEASNSQKPIRPRDLKSNKVEQKRLQKYFEQDKKHPLAIEIKRGVRPANYKKVEKWQRVTNEYIGQLIYACIIQRPGPARNQKNSIFSSAKTYKLLFLRDHDYNTLYDLVYMGNVYDEFANDFVKNIDDSDTIAVLKNGKLTILATICYLIKKQRHYVLNSSSDTVHEDKLPGFLVTEYPGDDLEKNLYEMFKFIIRRLKALYKENKDGNKITSPSNFFKTEQYYDLILKDMDSLDEYDREKIASYMKIFSKKK